MKHKLFDLLRRIGLLVLVVWTVVSLVTILIELVPGDPAVAVLGEQATPEQRPVSRQARTRPPAILLWLAGRRAWSAAFQVDGLNNRYDDYWVACCTAIWENLFVPISRSSI